MLQSKLLIIINIFDLKQQGLSFFFNFENSKWNKLMKNLYSYLFLFLLFLPTNLHADRQTDEVLRKLDKSLAQRNQYEQQHLKRINSLKETMDYVKAHGRQFEQLYDLFQEYKSYCYDSARNYAYACLEVAELEKDQHRIVQAKNAIAFSLISAGILSEALEVMKSIDRRKLTGELLNGYYDNYSKLWRSMADYVREEPYYTKYITQSNAYLDSLKEITPENTALWWSLTGSHQMRDHQFQDALQSFEKVLKLCGDDNRQRAMTTAEMAWAYVFLNDEDKAINYFAQSAIADNETDTREITALYHLSRFIYKKGDYERASVYVHQALEDVNFYNSRLRKVEINDILPIIEQDRYNAIRSQRNWLFATTGLFVVLMLAILWSYWFIRRKNRKLTEARETIAGQLEMLQQANRQLKEDDKIKNAYIGRSFYTNAEYIAKLEKLYLTIDRKIAARQFDDLRSMMKLSTLNAEREDMYEAFDQTFLKLFPDFVTRYNELFEEKDRRMPPNDHSLTSEMRIFALIRLGINDSERIAKFLDYSVHTVNTYKTRIKNRSTAENDQFEKLIMAI